MLELPSKYPNLRYRNWPVNFIQAYISHTMFTNLRWEPDAYNFFKEKRDKGAKAGFHGRDERYSGLV